MTSLTPAALLDVLSAPLTTRSAVVLPLHRNRKHVLPEARWGRLCVDDATLNWTAGDADRLQAMTRLRALGFSTTAMTRPAPPFTVLRQLPTSTYAAVITWWDELRPWRPNTPWFAAVPVLPPLTGAAGTAERLLLLLHYGVDWDAGWVSGKRHAYWDRILSDYVLQAALRAANLRRFW